MAPPAPKKAPSSHEPSLDGGGGDLLMEAMFLNQQTSMPAAESRGACAPAAAASSLPVPPVPVGNAVERLPDDWSLKKSCLITSPQSLRWCSELPASAQEDALRCPPGTAGSSLPIRLQQALLTWRHPAQRLPSALTRDLASMETWPKADQDFINTYRDGWDVALRSLYFALRSGRLPYFYCRGALLSAGAVPHTAYRMPHAACHGGHRAASPAELC